jgi:Domain of unknown function (DUF4166)
MHGPPRSPYQDLLGDAYDALAPSVRTAHEAPLTAEGAMDVVHGDYFLTPLLVRVMKLPWKGTNLHVSLHVTNEPHTSPSVRTTMSWRRQIGATVLDTRQLSRDGRLVEQSGPGTIEFALHTDSQGSLHYSDIACRFMGVPVPRFVAPRVRAEVSANGSGWHVDVTVQWRGRLVCRYGGAMRPVHQP